MKGEPWRQVCAAAKDLATRLTPEDRLSVVVYSDEARVLTSTLAGGPQLGAVANEICKMAPKGETNTLAGLALGYQQARAAYDPGSVNRVLLVSDGMPTIGPNDPYSLTIDTARALGEGITTSALGVGRDFDALLMDRVALEGGGNHHFVRDVAALPTVLTDELEVLSQQAAEAVDVRIRLADDVQLIEVIGSEPLSDAEALRVRQVEVAGDQRLQRDQGIAADRQKDREGGVRFLLPTFRAGDEHSFLLRVGVPPGNGRREVARVEVRYKDTIAGRNAAYAGGRGIEQGVPRETAEAQADQEVLLAEVEARAADTLQRASEYLDLANLPEIRQELYRAAVAVQRAADRSGSAVAHVDSDRLRQLADALTMAMQSGQRAWMVSAFHYYWRTCGVTAWQG
jgi:Ca-activated chloride channel family protein